MIGAPPHPPALAGPVATANILKTWLVDDGKTRSGVIGVDDALHVVSAQTFQHVMTQPALNLGMNAAIVASAAGIVAYNVTEDKRPALDQVFTAKLESVCETLNITLLDVLLYSPHLPKGWLSARQQSII